MKVIQWSSAASQCDAADQGLPSDWLARQIGDQQDFAETVLVMHGLSQSNAYDIHATLLAAGLDVVQHSSGKNRRYIVVAYDREHYTLHSASVTDVARAAGRLLRAATKPIDMSLGLGAFLRGLCSSAWWTTTTHRSSSSTCWALDDSVGHALFVTLQCRSNGRLTVLAALDIDCSLARPEQYACFMMFLQQLDVQVMLKQMSVVVACNSTMCKEALQDARTCLELCRRSPQDAVEHVRAQFFGTDWAALFETAPQLDEALLCCELVWLDHASSVLAQSANSSVGSSGITTTVLCNTKLTVDFSATEKLYVRKTEINTT